MPVEILDTLVRHGFEQVVALHDHRSGLRAFLAIHDTTRGPAFGGIRVWSYAREEEALRDCLRLARAMTAKCVMAGLPAGGAKLVLLDTPELDRAEAFRFLGRHVESMGGNFYTGPDVGMGAQELGWVSEGTGYVTDPGPAGPGLLAESTSAGVVAGAAAALRQLDGEEDWPARTVVVQGLGEVGSRVAGELRRRGARVLASELDAERGQEVCAELDLEPLDHAREFDPECDVFVPCALGGILHDLSIVRLRCRVVAGAANNVLASPAHGQRLFERGILYVPDFLINAGALIRGARFHLDGAREDVQAIGDQVGETVAGVLALAKEEELAPVEVAEREADRRLRAIRAGEQL